MMKKDVFYLEINLTPTEKNQEYNNLEKAVAYCCIKTINSQSAINIAYFNIERYDFIIQKIIKQPVIVNKETFIGKDLGLKIFNTAEKENLAFYYLGVAKNQNISEKEIKLKSSYNINLSNDLSKQKELSNRGRCLHYQVGNKCDEIIKAHSLQKKGLLSKISRKGKVYSISSSIGDMKKNNGNIILKEIGINKFSIFQGFCKYHDNELFEPIDNIDLTLTPVNIKQIFLYSYRVLSKELFEKQNSLEQNKHRNNMAINHKGLDSYFTNYLEAIKNGYDSLLVHKNIYDETLKNDNYEDIRYIIFNSKQDLSIVFSGVFYPEFDFIGNQLQDLSITNKTFNLISFSSAPTKNGWSFILSWHKSSDDSCLKFTQSLATRVHQKYNLGDLLFRFIIKSCENMAFSPIFWESLNQLSKNEISQVITDMVNPHTIITSNDLKKDLNGISNWKFEEVFSNIENLKK